MSNSRHAENFPIRPSRIRCYHFNRAFKVAFHSPQTRREHADSVIVRIDCQGGSAGFGESAPRPYVTGESCASVVNLIMDCFAPLLLGQPIDSLESLQTVLDRLEKHCRETGTTAYNAALGAIDLALLDALERSQSITPGMLFPDEARRNELRCSVSVPFLPLNVIQTYFPLFKNHMDLSVLKILVSEDAEETYERVKLIRRLAPLDSELRLEFNGKMALPQVTQILRRLTPFRIQAVEQPLPAGHFDGLTQLRGQYGLDLVADESLVTLKDGECLIEDGAYTIFNIKVSKCGGLLQSTRIARLADRHGIRCQVGTHVGESELLGIAGRRLARSLPNFDCYGGGSEVLFSRLFESHTPQALSLWPEDRDGLPQSACRDLVAQGRLLADTRAHNGPNLL